MALPSTGELSFSAIRTELAKSGAIDLNNSSVRGLAGKASGTISFSDLRGKSALSSFAFNATISKNLYYSDDSAHFIECLIDVKTKNVTASVTITNYIYVNEITRAPGYIGIQILNLSKTVLAENIFSTPINSDPYLVKRTLSVSYNSSSAYGETLYCRIVYKRYSRSEHAYGYVTNEVIALSGNKFL